MKSQFHGPHSPTSTAKSQIAETLLVDFEEAITTLLLCNEMFQTVHIETDT